MDRVAPIAWIAAGATASAVGAALGSGAGLWSPAVGALASGGAGLGLIGAVAAGSAFPSLQLYGSMRTRGDDSRPWVALTFDDGPDPSSTPQLLDALEAVGARATFFVLADRAQREPALVQEMALGHEVALHGLRHDPWLTVLPPERGAAQLKEAQDIVEQLTGEPLRWYRPPFGVTSPRLFAAVARVGLTPVWCSVRTRDGVRGSVQKLRRACQRLVPGDIALLHEGKRPAREGLPAILRDLSARGLQAVTVRELVTP